MKRFLLLFAFLCPLAAFGQGGNLGSNSSPVQNNLGRPLPGINISICAPLATTAASVTSNLAVLTMAANPVTAGFVAGQTIQVSGFTGGDTYFNGGTFTNGTGISSGFTIISVSSTTITYGLTHANASATSNGTVLQQGNATTGCGGLSSIFSDPALATSLTQPITSDAFGNWNAFAAPGVYYAQFYGVGITTKLNQYAISCVPSGATGTCGVYLNANNAFTGIDTFGNLQGCFTVDGTLYTTIQAAINAAPNGSQVCIPPGTYNFVGPLTITNKRILLVCPGGPGSTFLNNTSSTADAIDFSLGGTTGTPTRAAGVIGCAITAGGINNTLSSSSTGIGISVIGANDSFYLQNFEVRNHNVLVKFFDCFNVSVSNFSLLYTQLQGILIDNTSDSSGAGWHIGDGIISNNGATGTISSSVGIYWIRGSGLYVNPTVDITSMNLGLEIVPGAGANALDGFFNGMLADTSIGNNINLDGSTGTIKSMHFTNSWGAFSTNACGIGITGPNVDGVFWDGGRLRENGTAGACLAGGTNIRINGAEIAQNSKSVTNNADGVLVSAGVSQWSVMNSRSGDFASGLGTQQRYGININAGASNNFQIIGNDLRGNATGALFDNSTGTNKIISGNLPDDDTVNNTGKTIISGTCSGTASASVTLGLFPLSELSALTCTVAPVLQAGSPLPAAGIVRNLRVAVGTAGVNASSGVFTVLKNNVATAITCTTGTGFTCSDLVDSVAFSAGDVIGIQFTTQGAETLANVRASVEK